MIAINILYISVLYAGWVSTVSSDLTPVQQAAINDFLDITHTNPNTWASAFPLVGDYVLDTFLEELFELFGTMVDDHLQDKPEPPDFQRNFNGALDSIPRFVYLMRYYNLTFLEYLNRSFPLDRKSRSSPSRVIDKSYVHNVAARYHREKREKTLHSRVFIPHMFNVAVLFAQNLSMHYRNGVTADNRAKLNRYQDMNVRVYKGMARLMKITSLEPYGQAISELELKIQDLHDTGIRTFLSPEIQEVAQKLTDLVLGVIMMYGDSEASPIMLANLIHANKGVRQFLNVNDETISGTQRYWEVLLDVLRAAVRGILREHGQPGGHQWMKTLHQIVANLCLIGKKVH
jgi:hypothetical protein